MKEETSEFHLIINKKEIPITDITIDLNYNFEGNHNIIIVEVKTDEKSRSMD